VFAVATLLSVVACQDQSIRPDAGLHADDAHFPSAEFYACGQHLRGLGVCVLDPGESLSHLKFYIQGYYQGTMHVYAADCGLDQTFEYTNSELVDLGLTGKISQSCEITFLITPQFPGQTGKVVTVSPFKGVLKVNMRSKPGEKIITYVNKMKNGFNAGIKIPVAGAGPYHMLIEGCSAKLDKTVTPAGGVVTANTSEFLNPLPLRVCSMFGGIGTTPSTTWISWLMGTYDARFVDLAIPKITINGDVLTVVDEESTGVIAVDSVYILGAQATFSGIDFTRPFTLRLLTAGARSQIADWNPKKGKFEWLF